MGKGDRRTRRGKLYRGSHGKTRPKGRERKPPAPPGPSSRRPGTGARSG